MEEKLLVDIAKDLTVAIIQDPRRSEDVDVVKLYGRLFKKVLACYRDEYLTKERLEEGEADRDPFGPDAGEADATMDALDPDDVANEALEDGEEVADALEDR